jgi:hypothetical protein
MAYEPVYEPESPFGVTSIISRFMVYYIHRTIEPHSLDTVIRLNDERYVHRPDILANDLYGDPDLFWVIASRNGLQDPVFDFKMGELYTIPHPSYVRSII